MQQNNRDPNLGFGHILQEQRSFSQLLNSVVLQVKKSLFKPFFNILESFRKTNKKNKTKIESTLS